MHLEDKKKSLLFFWSIFFMYMMVYMTKSCFSAAMASIVDAGVLSKSQTGLITAVFYLAYTPLQIVGGVMADRFKPARIIEIGLLGAAIANGIIFFNQNYILMLITWGLNAVAQFGVWPGVFKILSSQLVPDQRKQAVFFISFSSTLGLMVAYIIAALVRRWESNFAIASAVLFALTIFFHIVAKRMEPHMVPDTVPRGVHSDEPIKLVKHNLPTKKLLLLGGVIFVVVYILLRAMVENGVKTLSSTMLMESYTQISPSIGNLLNTLIILSGVVGICFVRYVLSRFIKDEIVSTTLLLLVSLPLTLVLRHVGQGSAWIMVLSMCIIVAALNGTHYLSLAYNMRFTRYGLNATVAGIVNASASFGLVLQNYGFPLLAETTSWNYVANTWAIMLGISALALIVFLPRWKRFIAMENAEEIVEETV